MHDNSAETLPPLFFASLPGNGDEALLYEKTGHSGFRCLNRREAAAQAGSFVRALTASGIVSDMRVAFMASPSSALWFAEMGALANRNVAVILPTSFSSADVVAALLESAVQILFVDAPENAALIAASRDRLPSLKHIVHFSPQPSRDAFVRSWPEWLAGGHGQPDRLSYALRGLTGKSTALLFYRPTEKGGFRATRFSHAELLDQMRDLSATVAKHAYRGGILSLLAWDDMTGHVPVLALPILASMSIAFQQDGAIEAFASQPIVLFGRGAHFDSLRVRLTEEVAGWGKFEQKMFGSALEWGKRRFVSGEKPRLLDRLRHAALEITVISKLRERLGGRLRLLVAADDAVRYESQLFFYTLGIELTELHEIE